jgi:hypothetical protein
VRRFNCHACGQTLYFENVQCLNCGRTLGFLPDLCQISALEPAGDDTWSALGTDQDRRYRLCDNQTLHQVCNWLVPLDDGQRFCRACRHNETIPDLSVPANLGYWLRLEQAKRRLFYGLLKLRLPLETRQQNPALGLAFEFLADPDSSFAESSQVMTGHADGLITLNVAEADDAVREQRRLEMNELYRTVLGHFRHEIGHYYWERLIKPGPQLQTFRAVFGDERQNYDAALQQHYQSGPPADWQQYCVSAYASAHPWEDWAESWAHYLHMVDTLETARDLRLQLAKLKNGSKEQLALNDDEPYLPRSFDAMVEAWLPLTEAVNGLNRSMGQPDSYPFVLSPGAVEKVRMVHQIVSEASTPSR